MILTDENPTRNFGRVTLLVVIWTALGAALTRLQGVLFIAPLFRMTTMQPLVSMLRYALVIFPVFMLWGVWGRNAWVSRAIVYLSFSLQLYLSAQFVMWGWVG